MIVKSFTEAYVKAVTLVSLERQLKATRLTMSRNTGYSPTAIKNFEELNTVNIDLLDRYMEELNIFFRAEIEKIEE